jgi:hypothetical protein
MSDKMSNSSSNSSSNSRHISRKEEELARIVEYEKQRIIKRQLEEERARAQQTVVRLRDEKGREWNEVIPNKTLQVHTFRDSESKRLKTYSTRRGEEDKAYNVVSFSPAPPRKKKEKKDEQDDG